MNADLIMRSKVRSPAAGAFGVIVVGRVEPNSKALLAGLLSDMVVDVIVDRDLPLRDLPDVPWKAGAYFVISRPRAARQRRPRHRRAEPELRHCLSM
jgi:hypothetical protein